MDFPWGSDYHKKFITNVGLITSDGPHGPDIMAAEWTHLVSYSPAHILIAIGKGKATNENIRATNEFGVSLTAEDQNWISSIAGGSSGKKVDKIAALKEMGAQFYPGKKLNVQLVKGASLHAEVKVLEIIDHGSHTLFLGEVVEGDVTDKHSLAYHQNKYWKMNSMIEKPSEEKRAEMNSIVEKHAKA